MSDQTFDEAVMARIVKQRELAATAMTAGSDAVADQHRAIADELALLRQSHARVDLRQRREDLVIVLDWIDGIVRPRVRTTAEIDDALVRLRKLVD